jgi:hypothetical protein
MRPEVQIDTEGHESRSHLFDDQDLLASCSPVWSLVNHPEAMTLEVQFTQEGTSVGVTS